MTNIAKAVFGGGCFWCTEAVFKEMRGVSSVLPGYAGGGGVSEKPPTYEEVSSGRSGYVEVVEVEYDPDEVRYRDLLTVFFGSHDPTTLNRQGADVGTQYRSVVFYTTDEQKAEAEEFIREINASDKSGDVVVTTVEPLDRFYVAEDYHQNYSVKNPTSQYCLVVINPKLDKVKRQFAELLKK